MSTVSARVAGMIWKGAGMVYKYFLTNSQADSSWNS